MSATDHAVEVPMENSAVLGSARRRIISLDILRGLVIVIMVVARQSGWQARQSGWQIL